MSTKQTNNQDASANSPGAILRRCREYHDITLEEAAEATKIGINHLEALENDHIKGFASLAYLKGFLRIYATHLGLNADDMIRLYDKLYATPAKNDTQAGGAGDGGTTRRSRFSWRKLFLPGFLLALLIITSSIITRTTEVPARHLAKAITPQIAATPVQPPRSSATTARAVPADTQPSPSENVQKKDIPAERPAAAVSSPAVDMAKGFIVRMKVIHNSALAVTIDGSSAQSYELAVGDVIEWKADRVLTLDLSNAGGVEVELNGKQLKSLGAEGRPIYVTLDAEGVRS